MGNIVDTVEDRIHNANLTATDSFICPKNESIIRSLIECSGQDATSVMASADRGEHIGITALLRTYPKKILHYMC